MIKYVERNKNVLRCDLNFTISVILRRSVGNWFQSFTPRHIKEFDKMHELKLDGTSLKTSLADRSVKRRVHASDLITQLKI